MAWTAIGVIGGAQLVEEVDWHYVVSAVALSTIANFLACIAGIPEADLETEDISDVYEISEEEDV